MSIGQVGAIRLGVSKALQNWEPELRPALRSGIDFLSLYVDSFYNIFPQICLLLVAVLYIL